MKPIYTGLIIIAYSVCLNTITYSQPVPSAINDSTGAWRVNFITDNGSAGTWFTHDKYRYNFDGDTIVNDIIYHKLYKGGHYYDNDFFGGGIINERYYTHEYAGAIREAGAKWYFYGSSDMQPEQEYLLYDFTMNAGDPLPVAFNNPNMDLSVSYIDTILINNVERRRYFIEGQQGPGATFIIEGIGSDAGLIEPMQQFEYIWGLVCYAEDNEPVWPESGDDCDLNVSSQLIKLSMEQGISVLPNPFGNNATLRFPTMLHSGILQISDMQGRILLQYQLTRGQSEFEIYPGLKTGLYYLRIVSAVQSLSVKVIVN